MSTRLRIGVLDSTQRILICLCSLVGVTAIGLQVTDRDFQLGLTATAAAMVFTVAGQLLAARHTKRRRGVAE